MHPRFIDQISHTNCGPPSEVCKVHDSLYNVRHTSPRSAVICVYFSRSTIYTKYQYVCVCVCVCVCVHLYTPSIVEVDQVTHGQPGRHSELRSSAFHHDSSSCLYVYVYDTYNVLYRPGGYTMGSPVGCMESRELGRFVCVILYRPIEKFHDRCVCISLFTQVSLFTVYNKFWYEIN